MQSSLLHDIMATWPLLLAASRTTLTIGGFSKDLTLYYVGRRFPPPAHGSRAAGGLDAHWEMEATKTAFVAGGGVFGNKVESGRNAWRATPESS